MEKSRSTAIAAFVFGLFFWIPLINIISSAFAIYLGAKSLIKIKKDPAKYSGKGFAIAGIILGALVYVTYLIGFGMCLYGYGYGGVCKNIGLAALA
ncbi:DUF4190 domain-containing protein [Candidatus Woesearchaeota archaeon]|nr:DUF4190 domain-containing protein [Candidatus Woesearchaeota archaeon]